MKLKHGTVATRPGLLVALILTNVNVGMPGEPITNPDAQQNNPARDDLDYDHQQPKNSTHQINTAVAEDNGRTIFDRYGSVLYLEADPLGHPIPDPEETIEEEDDEYEINDNEEEEIEEDDEEEFI